MITLILVDDQPSVRRGLAMRLALEPDLSVVGEAENGEAALALARALAPDVVVMDVEMPRMDGLAAAQAVRGEALRCRVVIVSIHDDGATRERVRGAGATFVSKNGGGEELVDAIRRAAGTHSN